MIGKARYRVVIYLLVIACAYTVLSVLSGPSSPPWNAVRVRSTVLVDALTSPSYRVIGAADEDSDDGIVVARVLIQVIESPIYFSDEFEALNLNGFPRIEIGKRVETRLGVTSYYAQDQLTIDLDELETIEFVRNSVLSIGTAAQLTPTMKAVIVENASTQGRLFSYPRAALAMIANLLYAAAVFAVVIELILAYFRDKRRVHQSQNDLCLQCSYQLTREMSRCPECGHSVSWRAYSTQRS